MKVSVKKISMLFFIFLQLIVQCIALKYLPDQIPAHYGFNGEVTRWGNKYESLITPIIGVIFCLSMFIYTNTISKKEKYKNNIKAFTVCNIVLIILFNTLTFSFLITDFKQTTNLNNSLTYKLIYLIVGIIFVIIGNYLPKCKQNRLIGIRTKLTLSDSNIWFKTHRFAGVVFVIWGCIFTLASLILSFKLLTLALFIGLLLIMIIIFTYSIKFKTNILK